MGALTEPWLIKRRAKAQGAADVIRAESQLQVAEVHARAEQRVLAQEIRRQENIEAVVNRAARALEADADTRPPSPEPVSPDWTARLLGTVQDISDEGMQSLWARILAGEVQAPGTFSLRTLEIVRNLSATEANAFNALSLASWESGPLHTPMIFEVPEPALVADGIHFDTLSEFETIGLIRFNSLQGYTAGVHATLAFKLHDGSNVVLRRDTPVQFMAGNVMLTHAGRQLARLAHGEMREERNAAIVTRLRSQGWKVTRMARRPGTVEYFEVPI